MSKKIERLIYIVGTILVVIGIVFIISKLPKCTPKSYGTVTDISVASQSDSSLGIPDIDYRIVTDLGVVLIVDKDFLSGSLITGQEIIECGGFYLLR
jgi:hypothetical protein